MGISSLNRIASEYRLLSLIAVAVATAMFTGCEFGEEKSSATLVGTVSLDGVAVGDCQVALFDPTSKETRGAKVDAEGNFKFEDLLITEYQVVVMQVYSNENEEVIDQRIPQKYRDFNTSGLTKSVAEGENELAIEMTK